MKNKKKAVIIIFAILVLLGLFFYFRWQVYYSKGSFNEVKVVKIEKGEGNRTVGEKLESGGLIASKYYFFYYMWSNKLVNKILPDEYKLSGKMTVPEIAYRITCEQDKTIKITFPEGWDSRKMSDRLNSNGLDGSGFLDLVNNPAVFRDKHEYLQNEDIKTLEGYLFPDTYFFTRQSTAEEIVTKMLGIFNTKITNQMKNEILKKEKKLNDIVIVASIIEGEVRSTEDRRIVSGIFWKRIREEKPLESCATLAYILSDRKKQYTGEDTRVNSPFNTYIIKGLPPAPISNPGEDSIKAAIDPQESPYNFFLNDPETGETFFAVTYEEHLKNKSEHGL
jgi:UPF0755 protein